MSGTSPHGVKKSPSLVFSNVNCWGGGCSLFDDANKHESAPNIEEIPQPGFLEKRSVHIVLGLLLFVALSLVILSVYDESDSAVLAPDSTEAAPIALSEPPAGSQEFSPQVLEDFRTAPTTGLEIQPEPILLPPLAEQSTDISGDEESSPQEEVPEADVDDFPLEEALARYLISKRDELNRKYVEQCIQYRSRNGLGAECP